MTYLHLVPRIRKNIQYTPVSKSPQYVQTDTILKVTLPFRRLGDRRYQNPSRRVNESPVTLCDEMTKVTCQRPRWNLQDTGLVTMRTAYEKHTFKNVLHVYTMCVCSKSFGCNPSKCDIH